MTVEKRSLVVHCGVSTDAICYALVISDYPEPVRLSTTGYSKLIQLTSMGDDILPFFPGSIGVERAGYYAHVVLRGFPKGFASHVTHAVQRNTDIGDIEFNGEFMTAPGPEDDYATAIYSCSRRMAGGHQPCGWAALKSYAEKRPDINPHGLPMYMAIGVDDVSYIDSDDVNDTSYDIPHLVGAAWGETEYQSIIKWMAWAGMMNNLSSFATRAGRDLSLSWCLEHINRAAIWGDHEIFNDVAYGAESATYRLDGVGAAINQTVPLFKAREAAWDIFWKHTNGQGHFNPEGNELNPAAESRSRGFSMEFGYTQFIMMDRNYGDAANREGSGAFLWSQAQIDAASQAISNSSARFRVLGSPHQYRQSGPGSRFDIATFPECREGVFTNTTSSLMQKHDFDGSKFLMYQGDLHSVKVTEHGRADAGQFAEKFLTFNVAGMREPNGGMQVSSSHEAEKGYYDWAAADWLPPAGVGVLPEWRNIFDNTLDKSRLSDFSLLEANNQFLDRGEGVFLLLECFGSEAVKRTVASIVWGGTGKRQKVFEYLDDGGINMPSTVKKKISFM